MIVVAEDDEGNKLEPVCRNIKVKHLEEFLTGFGFLKGIKPGITRKASSDVIISILCRLESGSAHGVVFLLLKVKAQLIRPTLRIERLN